MVRSDSTTPSQPRPWIGVLFECCSVYCRVYRAPDIKTYQGRCPRCMRTFSIQVEDGGSDQRQFRAR